VIGFPEEGALMLRDYEYDLFGQTSLTQLLQGLAKALGTREETRPAPAAEVNTNNEEQKQENTKKTVLSNNSSSANNLLQFQKIVSHFYLVRSFV
jgi:hypothetical protein